MTNWAQFGHFHFRVYSLSWPVVKTLNAVCWVILRRQQIYTVIQAVHSLLYIVAKCHFLSVVTWKYIINYLKKNVRGCTHFCEILYICTVYLAHEQLAANWFILIEALVSPSSAEKFGENLCNLFKQSKHFYLNLLHWWIILKSKDSEKAKKLHLDFFQNENC